MKVKLGSGLVDLKCNTAIGRETSQYCHIHKVLSLSKVVMNSLRWKNLQAKENEILGLTVWPYCQTNRYSYSRNLRISCYRHINILGIFITRTSILRLPNGGKSRVKQRDLSVRFSLQNVQHKFSILIKLCLKPVAKKQPQIKEFQKHMPFCICGLPSSVSV
jgi:hypothetical protein